LDLVRRASLGHWIWKLGCVVPLFFDWKEVNPFLHPAHKTYFWSAVSLFWESLTMKASFKEPADVVSQKLLQIPSVAMISIKRQKAEKMFGPLLSEVSYRDSHQTFFNELSASCFINFNMLSMCWKENQIKSSKFERIQIYTFIINVYYPLWVAKIGKENALHNLRNISFQS
jgi:hypothetical protein